jgi:hypothetical protein
MFVLFIGFGYLMDGRVEGFTSPWSQATKINFINLQKTINPGMTFDTSIIQNQVSENEALCFLKNSKWNWSNKTQKKYVDAVSKNPYVRNLPQDSLNYAMKIYNEPAILHVLSMQSAKC